jgi:hypothetical protein
MMLLETAVLDNFRDDIDRFLLREGSIPAFLSTVTIAFSQGLIQPSDASQLPSSQQSSAAESGDTITINPSSSNKMVEVQVEGQSENESEVAEDEMEEEEEQEGGEEEEVEEEEDDGEEERYSDDEEDEEDDDEEEGQQAKWQQARGNRRNDGSDDEIVYIESD